MKESRLVPVGKIVRLHGVRGALKIHPYGESLALLSAGDKLFLHSVSRAKKAVLTLVSLRPQGKRWVMRAEELTGMDEAKEVVGEELFLPEDRLPPTSAGEYYHFQLLGLTVETLQGKEVGILSGIIETAGNDVYVLNREGREILIPAVEEVVCEVDLARGRMVIDPPEGLIDDL